MVPFINLHHQTEMQRKISRENKIVTIYRKTKKAIILYTIQPQVKVGAEERSQTSRNYLGLQNGMEPQHKVSHCGDGEDVSILKSHWALK